ncbi:XRE family transcriptional regulator [Stutzerimonas chloritidismutans]
MNHIGKRIALLREMKGWNQSELAREMKVTPQSVQAWEAGKNVPRQQKMTRLAEVLGVSVGDLMSDDAIEGEFQRITGQLESNVEQGPPIVSPYRAIPIVGTAQMGAEGYWYALEEADGTVDAYSRDASAYALRLKGDSMEPAIHSGWVAVIEPDRDYFPGEYVMVRTTEGESMLKRLLYCNEAEVSLLSVNGHAIRNIPTEQIEHIHSVGAIVPPSRARV